MKQDNEGYIKCYSVVLKLCDENDKAKDLNEYYKDKLLKHIGNTVVPRL